MQQHVHPSEQQPLQTDRNKQEERRRAPLHTQLDTP
jgi:hypothetical protein